MKKLFNVLLAGICLASVCAVSASAAAITTTDAVAGKTAAAPKIDGVYDPAEGWGDPIVTIVDPDTSYLGLCATNNPELLTDKNLIPSETKVYFRWDDTNFYYCATLIQQQRFNNYDWTQAGAIWQGDSVSYNIKSTLDNDSKTRCLFALTAEDGLVYCEETYEDMTAGISAYDYWKIGRNEDTKTTTYEIYFSWEDVIPSGEMKAGDVFYFRDLYMPAINETFKNPVDFNTAGITASGSYNYWKITLAEDGTAAAEPAAPAAEAAADTATEDTAPALQNLCAGATVTEVSGLETEGANTGDMAIDGDITTRWSSNTSDDAHIIIDIGSSPLPIGYVEIHWETACAQDYTIETSSDGTSWDVKATVTGNTAGTSPWSEDCVVVHEWTPATARYIKINCTKRNTEWGNSIWEIVARKAADTVESTAPAAYPASGTEVPADSVLINGERIGLEAGWGGNAAAGRDAAFDGDVNTFFDPLGTGDGWAGVDAGEEMILTKIVIHPRDGWADRFNGGTIEGANEEDFSDAVALFFSVEAASEVTFLDVTDELEEADNTGYRYFRYINYTNHGDVAEVELYGKAVDGSNPTYGAAAAEEAPAVEETPVVEEVVEASAEEPAAEEVAEEPAAEEVPVEEPAEEVVEETVEEVPAAAEVVEEAPQTFDFGVIAAVTALISAAGYALTKKR